MLENPNRRYVETVVGRAPESVNRGAAEEQTEGTGRWLFGGHKLGHGVEAQRRVHSRFRSTICFHSDPSMNS